MKSCYKIISEMHFSVLMAPSRIWFPQRVNCCKWFRILFFIISHIDHVWHVLLRKGHRNCRRRFFSVCVVFCCIIMLESYNTSPSDLFTVESMKSFESDYTFVSFHSILFHHCLCSLRSDHSVPSQARFCYLRIFKDPLVFPASLSFLFGSEFREVQYFTDFICRLSRQLKGYLQATKV